MTVNHLVGGSNPPCGANLTLTYGVQCDKLYVIWAVSANGNTSGLQPEIESSILSRSTKFALLVKW